jgi:hypothetical protein
MMEGWSDPRFTKQAFTPFYVAISVDSRRVVIGHVIKYLPKSLEEGICYCVALSRKAFMELPGTLWT